MSAPDSDSPILGEYTDGVTARSTRVRFERDAAQIALFDAASGALVAEWPLADLEVGAHAENVTRVSPKGSRASVTFTVPPARILGERHARLPLLQRALLYLAGTAVAIAAVHFSLPAISRVAARRVPIEYEKAISSEYLKYFLEKECKSPRLEKALAKIVDRLEAGSPPRYPYRVSVTELGIDNALALPGGQIAIGRELLRKTLSSEELAAVLAHEIRHVEERHILAGIIRASTLTALWTLVAADFTSLLAFDPSMIYNLAAMRFQRADEAEADEGALRALDAARISRTGFVNFFERIGKEGAGGKLAALISTHPGNEDRIERIKRGDPGNSLPLIPLEEWQEIKGLCN